MQKKVIESKEVVVLEKQLSPIVLEAKSIKILNPQDMETAVETLSKLNKINDKIVEKKEKITRPALDILAEQRSLWKPIESLYKEAIDIIRKKMSEYQTEQIRIQQAEESKIIERTGQGKGKFSVETAVRKLDEIEKPDAKIIAQSGSVKFRPVQKLKITNESKIPDEYWKIDEDVLFDALKEGVKINGAEIEIIQVPVNSR